MIRRDYNKTGHQVCFMLEKLSPKQIGKYGEKVAGWYYRRLGFTVIGQNLWTRYGEIDLLLTKGNKILAVEVKTRRNANFGPGEETVSEAKLEHLIHAYHLLQAELGLPDEFDLEVCVLEILGQKIKISRWLI